MLFELGQLLFLAGIVQGHAEDIEVAGLLSKVVNGLFAGYKDRVAVFAGKVGQLTVAFIFGIIQPQVAGDGGSVVLPELVLVAFSVVVDEQLAVGAHPGIQGRHRQGLLRHAAFDGYLVELREYAGRELYIGGNIQPGGGEQHFLAIGGKVGGVITGGMVGQALGRPAFSRHDVHVEVTVAVGSKGDLLTVVRPYGHVVIGLVQG